MPPKGTIAFSTVGRTQYGFDIFSVSLPSILDGVINWTEHRLTDGKSVNFNGNFIDENETLAYVSERTGAARIYLNRAKNSHPEKLSAISEALFQDRPVVKNGFMYFVSAREPADKQLKSWSAVYSTRIQEPEIKRLTPYGIVDYSPALSRSGKFVAVASYGSRPWTGDFHELDTDIVIFRSEDPNTRMMLRKRGGWPTWSGDSIVFFHRKAEDGWWSIFRADLTENLENSGGSVEPRRITPPGLHAFTPAASHDGNRIAVATRRPGTKFRHVEIFDLKSESFYKVTETLNPNFHHYNPFFSPESGFLGYHRFRGDSVISELTIPHLDPVESPIKELRMLRLNGNFPTFSPDGKLIAFNRDFDTCHGVRIVKSDGSKRWTVVKDRTAFYTAWSPTEKGVIYTSVGPIFESAHSTVQIARISFNPADLDDREEIPADVKILTKEDTANNAFPSCSPDGKYLVFRSGRNGHKNLYIIDAVNGEFNGGIRQLTVGPWIDTMPSWSPDGKLIAFSSNRHNPDNVVAFSIYLIRPDGTGLRRVHVAGPEGSADVDRERINHVCFSPDSTWLLFAANLGGVSAEPVSLPNQFQPYGDLFVARLDGSELQRLTWNAYENGTPAWHSAEEVDFGSLSLETGEKLTGRFDEPLWISCDI
ncbi:tolB protein-like protein [Tasmannia lanceolata]|uniref:tolB protein-like protein n=1 Tax=Tasmannia lanceolata TaxID=3420 RepID=UPI0040642D01